MFGAAPAASNLSRLVSIWAVRLGPGHLVTLSAAVMALAADITWGWVKGEARWLISWDAGVLTYLALSWAVVVLLDARGPVAGCCASRRPVLRSSGWS
jgi:hypothetical protein